MAFCQVRQANFYWKEFFFVLFFVEGESRSPVGVGTLNPENTTERKASCTTSTHVSQDGSRAETSGKVQNGCFEIVYVSERTGSVHSALSAWAPWLTY